MTPRRLRVPGGCPDHEAMATFADADAAVEHLADLEESGRLPFTCYQLGSREGGVDLAVPAHDQRAALPRGARSPSAHAVRPIRPLSTDWSGAT
jgi:hypothetical protein